MLSLPLPAGAPAGSAARSHAGPAVHPIFTALALTCVLPATCSAQVLAYDGTGLAYEIFYVEADKLVPCDATKSCIELGGNCQDQPDSCCKLPGQGGGPAARCAYPPEVVAPSACVKQ